MSNPKIFKIMFLLLILPMFSNNILSENKTVCGLNLTGEEWVYPYYPVKSYDAIKALVIFVRYQDDNFDCCDGWPVNRWDVPAWYNKVLTPINEQIIDQPSLSGFFDAMSGVNGNHGWQLRGDEYPYLYVTQNDMQYYSTHGGLGAVSQELFQALDGNINFANYDRYDPLDLDNDKNLNEPDGVVDMIILWFRWMNAGSVEGSYFSGVAKVGAFPQGVFLTTNDYIEAFGQQTQVKIMGDYPHGNGSMGSGIMAEGTSLNSINIFAHEIGHYLLGPNHNTYQGLWSLMNGNGIGIMNTTERFVLGWIPQPVFISNQYGTTVLKLKDFETTGESYEISAYPNDVYFLENRSSKGFYSKYGNWIMPANGLLINFSNSVEYKIISADHKWQWELYGNGVADCNCIHSFNIKLVYPFQKLRPSNTGYSEMDLHNICSFDGNSYACRWGDSAYGHAGDLWDVSFNNVFSPWSNPNSLISSNGKGIVIEILNENPDGSMDVLLKYGVQNGEAGTSPSKPLYLRCEQNIFDMNDIYKYHPKLTWIKNTEPDMDKNAFYKIFRADMTGNAQYSQIAVIPVPVSGTDVTYIDAAITLYSPNHPSTSVLWTWKKYMYKVQAVDNENLSSVFSDPDGIDGYSAPHYNDSSTIGTINTNLPKEYNLYNYPNPFNPSTEIRFSLPKDEIVTIEVFNLLGEKIAALVDRQNKEAGNYRVIFDGTNLASGIYLYRITAGNYNAAKKMVLIR